jgi:hypothetical protein
MGSGSVVRSLAAGAQATRQLVSPKKTTQVIFLKNKESVMGAEKC